MISTKMSSTKNIGILIAAIFSLAVSVGLSQGSFALAINDNLNCDTEVAFDSTDMGVNESTSCSNEDDKNAEQLVNKNELNLATSSEDEDNVNSNNNNKVDGLINASPAVASPEDNIIKPINLNKGLESDEPLETNNVKQKPLEESETVEMIQENMDISDRIDEVSETSELYKSFDLPYTALYKNQ